MDTFSGHPSITADAQALLAAVGIPVSLEGARPALAVARACLRAAAVKWPDAPLQEWLHVADDLASSLSNIAASDQKWAVRLSNHPLEISQPLKGFLGWGPSATVGVEFALTAIIGRAIAQRAEQRSVRQKFGRIRRHRAKRGLRGIAKKEKADRARLWLGQDRGQHEASDGAWPQARGPDVRADDGGLQLGAHAHAGAIGTGASAGSKLRKDGGKSGPSHAQKRLMGRPHPGM